MQWHQHDNDDTLAEALAEAVATDLEHTLSARGHALLALSGGNTPKRFMQALSRRALDWAKVSVTLVDERWVPPTHPRSNARLVDQNLLHGKAAEARFVPLYMDAPTPENALPRVAARVDALPLPPDVVVLGMGTNGHTASFFPGGDHLAEALDPKGTASVLPMRAPDAGEPRITLTLPVLVAAPSLYLQIEGAKKRHVFEQAAAGADYPMRAVIEAAPQLQTFWCP
ncbi:MAG TPA: 6-phosphogluconolactonase [Rhodanobacteraceae bacterium]|nr:6-phosphogluconolactonase [Rhodanobacteraceae bacterium]